MRRWWDAWAEWCHAGDMAAMRRERARIEALSRVAAQAMHPAGVDR